LKDFKCVLGFAQPLLPFELLILASP
jgi:hypothetical protein